MIKLLNFRIQWTEVIKYTILKMNLNKLSGNSSLIKFQFVNTNYLTYFGS